MKLSKKKLKICDMHCVSCAMNIDFDLEDLDGVKSAKTSYAKSISEIEFDEEKVTIEQIMKTISNTGYKAELSDL